MHAYLANDRAAKNAQDGKCMALIRSAHGRIIGLRCIQNAVIQADLKWVKCHLTDIDADRAKDAVLDQDCGRCIVQFQAGFFAVLWIAVMGQRPAWNQRAVANDNLAERATNLYTTADDEQPVKRHTRRWLSGVGAVTKDRPLDVQAVR